MRDSSSHAGHARVARPYLRLLAMAGLSFAAMYALMYAMVDRFENVLANWNQVYMAGLMTAPMVIIELLLMRSMYRDSKLNAAVLGAIVLLGVGCFLAVRRQAAIGDVQFLKSMIPHHAAALLMCEEAEIRDRQVIELCERIRRSQQAEIAEMREVLKRLGR